MKRKILFHLYALAGGGAERVVATLASGLAGRGHEVILATDWEATDSARLVAATVRQVDLGRSHASATLRLARLLRHERPDASLSATGVSNLKHALAALAAGRARRAILTFHGDLYAERGLLSGAGNLSSAVLTRVTARSVYVSDALRRSYRRLGASQRRARRIYNPVPTVAADGTAPADEPHVLAVGRLVPLKRFDTLLDAFARLGQPDATMTILGEGPERPRLEREIRALGLAGRVALPGWTDDPTPFYQRARCFALASERESFGNVVVEALAHGLPVVATECGGPAEILDGGRYGRLVPIGDVDAMARELAAALADPGDPAPRRERAAVFTTERALDAYEALIEEAVAAA